jgi:hypothetical protein
MLALTRARNGSEGHHHNEREPVAHGYDNGVNHNDPEDAEAETAVNLDTDDRESAADERNDRAPRCVDGRSEASQRCNRLKNRVPFFDLAHLTCHPAKVEAEARTRGLTGRACTKRLAERYAAVTRQSRAIGPLAVRRTRTRHNAHLEERSPRPNGHLGRAPDATIGARMGFPVYLVL